MTWWRFLTFLLFDRVLVSSTRSSQPSIYKRRAVHRLPRHHHCSLDVWGRVQRHLLWAAVHDLHGPNKLHQWVKHSIERKSKEQGRANSLDMMLSHSNKVLGSNPPCSRFQRSPVGSPWILQLPPTEQSWVSGVRLFDDPKCVCVSPVTD